MARSKQRWLLTNTAPLNSSVATLPTATSWRRPRPAAWPYKYGTLGAASAPRQRHVAATAEQKTTQKTTQTQDIPGRRGREYSFLACFL